MILFSFEDNKLSALNLFPALLLVTIILVAFYWMCKGANRFFQTPSNAESPTEAPESSADDNELEMRPAKKRLKSLDIFRGEFFIVQYFICKILNLVMQVSLSC